MSLLLQGVAGRGGEAALGHLRQGPQLPGGLPGPAVPGSLPAPSACQGQRDRGEVGVPRAGQPLGWAGWLEPWCPPPPPRGLVPCYLEGPPQPPPRPTGSGHGARPSALCSTGQSSRPCQVGALLTPSYRWRNRGLSRTPARWCRGAGSPEGREAQRRGGLGARAVQGEGQPPSMRACRRFRISVWAGPLGPPCSRRRRPWGDRGSHVQSAAPGTRQGGRAGRCSAAAPVSPGWRPCTSCCSPWPAAPGCASAPKRCPPCSRPSSRRWVR